MAISKDKKKIIDGVLGKINKKFGAGITDYLVNIQEELKIKFFKTPSHEVNLMLGGGIGKGKIVEFYGANSSGKTSMALEIIAKAQKEDPEFMAAWIETERSLDSDYIASFGIDMDRLIVAEQSEDFTAEACMDVIRSLVNSEQFGMIVLNSVAALSPKKEVEDELEKQNMALTARLLSKFLRITTGSLGKTKTSLILINQVRQNLGSMYGGNVTTGGMAIPFYATQRIEFKREKVMAGDVINEEQGVKIRCKVVKNRLAKGNPFKICNYYALYGKGIDGTSELPSVLAKEGIISGSSWIYYPDKDNLKKVPSSEGEIEAKWNGKAKFADFLRDNPEGRTFFEKLLDEKLSTGTAGESVSDEEMKELEEMNSEIEAAANEFEETAATE
jgi:recombination protein RecA